MPQDQAPPIEQRSDSRHPVSWRACILFDGGETLDARVTNVSSHGVGITTDRALPVSALLTLTVSVADLADRATTLEVCGRVRITYSLLRGHDFLAGVEWIEMHEPGRSTWDQWVRRLNRPAAYGTVTSMAHL